GAEGFLGYKILVSDVAGTWEVIKVRFIAVACGDLNEKITVDVKGEILDLKNTANNMWMGYFELKL
ncbi:8717_t:CDS:2, partial [Diversispora eburnea]